MSIVLKYLEYHKKYQHMYGTKTVVLMQIGSFHECYSLMDGKGPDVVALGDMCNLVVTRKNNKVKDNSVSIKNPYLIGVPSNSISKYVDILVQHDYVVVMVDQVTLPPNPKREVTAVHSKGTYLPHTEQKISNYILSVYINEVTDYKTKQTLLGIGLSVIDIGTGKLFVHSVESTTLDTKLALDELIKFLDYFSPIEIILNSQLKHISLESVYTYCGLHKYNIIENHYFQNIFLNISYQNDLYMDVWKVESQLSPIEYFELTRRETIRISLTTLLSFVKENKNMTNDLEEPIFYSKQPYLKFGNNLIHQLNIIDKPHGKPNSKMGSLFQLVNHTRTCMGSRHLRYQLLHPSIDVKEIRTRYQDIQTMISESIELSELKQIKDIEKLSRKLSMFKLTLRDMYSMIQSLEYVSQVFEKTQCIARDKKLHQSLTKSNESLCSFLKKRYNLDMLKRSQLNNMQESVFLKGVNTQVDECEHKCSSALKQLHTIQETLSRCIDDTSTSTKSVKLEYNDRYGYHFEMTTIRFGVLKKKYKNKIPQVQLDKIQCTKIKKGRSVKIGSDGIRQLSDTILEHREQIQEICKQVFTQDMVYMREHYMGHLKEIIRTVAYIDFIYSGKVTAQKYNYKKPTIKKGKTSYFSVKKMRHPIVEQIIDTAYIPHDIELGKKVNGILLYGLNSAGKSTIMKAIGLNLILAQVGYFVPSEKLEFSPYENLFCRISSNDNLFKGLSSYHLELTELDAILNRFDSKTMVLADEVCKGTEHTSALIIVTCLIQMLSQKKSSFISATHLHDLAQMEEIKSIPNLCIQHLKVECDYKNKRLVYDRVLKKGSGPREYGLSVASFLMKNKEFIKNAQALKNNVFNHKIKKSRYNPNVYVKHCQICNHVPKRNEIPLETHHIVPQKDTDSGGFLLTKAHVHKNRKSNLIVLCSTCHDKIHNGILHIDNSIQTSSGKKNIH